MKRILAAFLLLFSTAPFALAVMGDPATAAAKIAAGRAALVRHDLVSAQTHFSNAINADASNQTAWALRGFTDFFTITGQAGTTSLLNGLNVPSSGRDLYDWTAKLPHDGQGNVVLPGPSSSPPQLPYNLTTAEAFWRDTLVIQMAAARADLEMVNTLNPNFLLTLYPWETTMPAAINIDYGDVLMARASLSAIEFVFHFLSGQYLDANLYKITNDLAQGNLLTLQKVLADNPNLFTLKAADGSTSERASAQASLNQVISLYRQASTFIRTQRPAGVNRLFMLDAKDLAQEADFRAMLDKLELSFTEPVATDKGNGAIFTGPLFGPSWVMRNQFPTFNPAPGGFNLESITDPSLGGVAAGLTRESIAHSFDHPELGWTWVSPTPQGNALYRHLTLTSDPTKRIVSGDAGTVFTSSDSGTTWTLRTVAPRTGRIAGLAEGAGKVVAVGFNMIFVSADSGATWQSVFKGGGQFRAVTYGGGKFVAVGDGGVTAVSSDGQTWQFNYGGNFSLNDVLYTGSVYLAVGIEYSQSRAVIFTTSGDSVNWTWTNRFTAAATNPSYGYNAVAQGGSNVVAVGGGNHSAVATVANVATSSWTASTVLLSGSTSFNGVAYRSSDLSFIAAGSGGAVASVLDATLTSTPASNWGTAVTTGETLGLNNVGVASDGVYFAGNVGIILRSQNFVAGSGTFTRVLNPVVPGASAVPLGTQLNSLRAIGGKLYVVGSGATILRSSDGQSFSALAPGITNTFALWGILEQPSGTLFVVGDNGTIITSTDSGATWSAPLTTGTTSNLRTIHYLNGQFVAGGLGGVVLTSTTGATSTWTSHALPGANAGTAYVYSVAYGAGTLVAVGGNGQNSPGGTNLVCTSTDNGVTWVARTPAPGITNTFRSVVFNQGAFMAAGLDGALYRSADGINWAFVKTGASLHFYGLRVLDGRYYLLQASGGSFSGEAQCAVLVSSDGQNWVRVPQGAANFQIGVELFNGRLYTAGGGASILRSEAITASSVNTPVPLAAAPGSAVTQGTDHVLAVTTAGAAGSQTFAWQKGGTPLPSVTGPVLNLKNVQFADGASYSVTVTNAAGTSSAATFAFSVSDSSAAPTLTQQPDSQTVSVGLNATFTAAAQGTGALSYQWKKDTGTGPLSLTDGAVSGAATVSGSGTATLTLTGVQSSDAAAYTVVVTCASLATTTSLSANLTVDSNPAYLFSTFAGLAFNPGTIDSPSGPGSAARFNTPNGVTIDGAGNVYVADTNNNSIRKITSGGNVSTVVSGLTGSPVGIVLVGSNLYFTAGDHTVRVVSTGGGTVTVLAGNAGSAGSADGAGLTTARFNNPRGITSDGTYLYVADTSNHTIRRILISDGSVSTFAGAAGIFGSTDTSTGPATAARFNGPQGIAISGTNLFVADTDNNTIRKIVISSGVVTTFAGKVGFFGTFDGTGSAGGSGALGTFAAPVGIAVDTVGYVYVTDNNGEKLRKIAPDGSFVRTIGGQPFRTGGSDGMGSAALFNNPSGIALDSAANLYIADTNNHTIRKGVPSASISAPEIGLLPMGQTVTTGGSVAFKVSATGAGTLSYLWKKNGVALVNGVNVSGADTATLTLTGLQASDAANYTVVVTNSPTTAIAAVSAIAALTVAPGPEITGQPIDRAVRVGANVNFSVVASGAATYQWLKNLMPIGDATTATLSLTNVLAGDAGHYRVLVSNSTGSVTSRVATLTVNAVSDGIVVAWGNNSYDQTTVPAGLNGVTAIAAGDYHTVALKSDGTVVAWGWGLDGQTTVPTGLSGVTDIAAGYIHTVALKSDGTVVAWGSNTNGQTTVPSGLSGVTAIAAGYYHTVALKNDGTVVVWGNNSWGQRDVPAGLNGVTAIAAGYMHTVALKSDGTVVAWGQNLSGQTTVPAGLSGVKAIAAGNAHTVALKKDGTVVAWGDNTYGETNVSGLSGVTAIAAGYGHTVALKSDRTVVAWGKDTDGQTNVPGGLSGVTAIAAGTAHTVALVMPPNFTVLPASQIAGAGASVSFSVVASGASAYQWLRNGVPIDGETTATLSLTNVQAAAGAVYTIVASNGGGTAMASATLAVGSDFFAGRTVISGQGVTTVASNVGATKETGASEPNHVGNAGGASVWWTWTAPKTGVVTIDTIGSDFNTLLAVYTGSAVGSLTSVISASDDDSGGYGTSKVTFNVTAGTVYQIAVDGFGGASGNILLNLNYAYAFTTFAGSGAYGHFDATGTSAQFKQPAGVAVDGAGNLYVADIDDSTIRKITPAGVVTTLAGSPGLFAQTDGTGSGARFAQPVGVAVDGGGNVFVIELGNNTPGALRKVTPLGVVTTLATGFNQPFGVALDGAGNAYVTDSNNSMIKKVTPAGVVTTVAGQSGVFGDTDGPVSDATLGGPVAIAIDPAGNIFVATGSQTIRKITPAGIVSTFAGIPAGYGSANGVGSAARFDGAYGLAFDSAGNLYVAERGVGSVAGRTIRRITPAGVVTTLAGQPGSAGSADGVGSDARFNTLIGIAVDAAGNIFVGDVANHTVRKGSFAFAPQIQTQPPANQTVAGGGTATFTVGATSGLPLTYQWRKGGNDVPSATTATLTLNNLQGSAAGSYTVVVSNLAGSVTSSAATLTVLGPSVSTMSPTSVTSGASVTLTGTGFTSATAVKFNGLAAAFTIVSDTSITTTVPLGVTSGAVTVVGLGGTSPATTTYTAVVTPVSQTLYVATGQGSNGQLFTVDPATAAATLVGNITVNGSAVSVTGLAFNPLTHVLYGVTGDGMGSSSMLVTIDPATGLATLVGSLLIGGESSVGSSDISFDVNGKLYSWRTQGGPLGTINLTTAAVTSIGSSFNGEGGNGLAFTPDGTLYVAGPSTGSLFRVNTTTGALTAVASLTGAPSSFGTIDAMASNQGGLLYAVANGSPSTLVTINAATGAITTVGTLPFSTADAIAFAITPQLPPITAAPANATVTAGGSVTLSFAGTIVSGQTFQWLKNGAAIAGATSSTLTLSNATVANTGVYSLAVTTPEGTLTSAGTMVRIVERGLLGLMSHVIVPAGGSVAASFTVEGPSSKAILIRGAGPGLASFGTTNLLADPRLALFDGTGASIATNDDWGSSPSAIATAAASVGAFPFISGSKDAAILATLNPGTYTAVLDGVGGVGGAALLQVFDADSNLNPRVVMLTTRARVDTNSFPVAGFAVTGTGSKNILVRVLGQSLGQSDGVLRDPMVAVFNSSNVELGFNDNWQNQAGGTAAVTAVNSAVATVGARPLGGSFDATLLLSLASGAYTAQVTPFSSGSIGEVFIEIFDADDSRPATLAPVITYLAKSQAAMLGGQVVFGVNAIAKPAPTYQWRRHLGTTVTPIAGATDPVLYRYPVQSTDVSDFFADILTPVTYDVVITNSAGSVTSAARAITLLPSVHSADYNGGPDGRIDLLELTRVIQLYNYRSGAVRTGEYHTQAGTEDGFAPGPGAIQFFHSADSNHDGRIDPSELQRVIEIYNFVSGTVRIGHYYPAPGTVDGFAPGFNPAD